MAEQLGNSKVAKLLSQTQIEEENADKLLTELAKPILARAGEVVITEKR
jgi:ferritin-like metal-binding protein YciE